jgi:YHYH protein
MAKPLWTIPSNFNLGIFAERNTLNPIDFRDANNPFVLDIDDIATIETSQFKNNTQQYANVDYVYIRSNGLAQTPWLGEPNGYTSYSPIAQSYVFKIPRIRLLSTSNDKISTIGFFGVATDGVPFKNPNTGNIHNFNGTIYTENSVIYPVQDYFTDGSGLIGRDKRFYYQSDPALIYNKDPMSHSPIIGYAFDGLPIYGPYGYSQFDDTSSPVKVMTSSYRLKSDLRSNGTTPDGTFIEDFEYVSGSGDLDQYNSRFCKTPEYPQGVQAYFVTVDPTDMTKPVYPYIIGPQYFGVPILPNGSFQYPGDINFSVISGDLPGGLRLSGSSIIGTPYDVFDVTEFRFVIRAENLDGITDRTLYITITGPTLPQWETPAGDLPVGVNGSYWILDNSLIEFQLSATYQSLPIGHTFSFYIPPNGGQLPPGITLSLSGLLSGFTQPVLSVVSDDTANATYDMTLYDKYNYDYGVGPYDGYDSFFYDNQTYDYSNAVQAPRKLNQYYSFIVRASDGRNFVDRQFRIYVVSDDHLRADDTIMKAGNNIFTADDTFLRKPIWLTPQYLGSRRANNYITIPLKVYTSSTLQGTIGFVEAPNNNEAIVNRASWATGKHVTLINGSGTSNTITVTSTANLIVGMNVYVIKGNGKFVDGTVITHIDLNGTTFTVSKNVASAVSNATIYAVVTTASITVDPSKITGTIKVGYHVDAEGIPPEALVSGWDTQTNILQISWDSPTDIGNTVGATLRLGTVSTLPPGMVLDQLSGAIYGDVPYQSAVTNNYKFTIIAIRYDTVTGDTIKSYRTFNIDILGEIDSVIRFVTNGNLGSIAANLYSDLNVSASTTISNAVLTYTLVGGSLPPGLELNSDGTIQGKVNQFGTLSNSGLTTFDSNNLILDGYTTTIDRSYKFIVLARDQFNLSSTTKVFTISVITPNDRLYSNIYVKPFLDPDMRTALNNFFIDKSIFEPSKIYRPSDPEFGIQKDIKIFLYAGIETKSAAEYVSAFGRTSRKSLRIGNLKKGIATDINTQQTVYETVYLEVLDNLENEYGSTEFIDTKLLNHPVTVNQSRRDIIDGDLTGDRIAASSKSFTTLPIVKLQDRVMSADFTGQLVSDTNKSSVFINNFSNIRNNISALGYTDPSYLPLWMRTLQSYSGVSQSFTKAIVLCYCLQGTADSIILNIKNSGFDFSLIDLTIDRAIIDSVTGETGAKYIAFPAREVIND